MAVVLDGIAGFEREENAEPSWKWFATGSPLYRASRLRRGQSATESSDNVIGTTSLGYIETRKGTLVLSVNSQERAERGRELLASRLGDLVGPALIAHQTPERALEERSGQGPDEPEIPPKEALQVMHSYLDEHYRRTLDDPLPMLDGMTLREAAATRKGRERVVDWLEQLENASTTAPRSKDTGPTTRRGYGESWESRRRADVSALPPTDQNPPLRGGAPRPTSCTA